MRRVLVSALGVAVAALLCASSTASATVQVFRSPDGQALTLTERVFGGLTDSASQVTLGLDPSDPASLLVTSSSGIAAAAGECTLVSATSARCPAAGLKVVFAGFGEFDDSFQPGPGGLPATLGLNVSGDGGNDLIIGRNADGRKQDQFFGGAGNDTIRGLGGRDLIVGAGGNDRLSAGAGDDDMFGGGGADRLNGGAGDDVAKGGPGKDRFKGVEEIVRR